MIETLTTAPEIQRGAAFTLRKEVANRQGRHEVLGSDVPHTAERVLLHAADAGKLFRISSSGSMVLELAAARTAAAPTVTRIRQKLPLLAGHGHAVNQVLVIRDCALHQVLTAEQLQALAGGFRTAYHAALRRENKHLDPKHLMQQVARLDGTPAALPTGAAAATKDKKSGVSFGECCINLGYRIPQNKKVAAPGLYAKHAHEEWRLFCDTVAKGVVSDCWTFIAAQRPFSRLCETMLKLNQNAQFAPGTGFSSISCTSDLARGVHTDWGNLLITAILAVIDKEAMKRATGAAHVIFG